MENGKYQNLLLRLSFACASTGFVLSSNPERNWPQYFAGLFAGMFIVLALTEELTTKQPGG